MVVAAPDWWSRAHPGAALEAALQVRARGCGNHRGIDVPLQLNQQLLAGATAWARGVPLHSALQSVGYRDRAASSLHLVGFDNLAEALAGRMCESLTDRGFTEFASVRAGDDVWIVLAAPWHPPGTTDVGQVAEQILARVNRARAESRRCGRTFMAPAPPVVLDERLATAARAHAEDMLLHRYFEHQGSDGSSPAQRVSAAGYRHQLVGENIASGSEDAAETVSGWLDSPPHCENIMDPRFVAMGVAAAGGSYSEPTIYWVQVFATPFGSGR